MFSHQTSFRTWAIFTFGLHFKIDIEMCWCCGAAYLCSDATPASRRRVIICNSIMNIKMLRLVSKLYCKKKKWARCYKRRDKCEGVKTKMNPYINTANANPGVRSKQHKIRYILVWITETLPTLWLVDKCKRWDVQWRYVHTEKFSIHQISTMPNIIIHNIVCQLRLETPGNWWVYE